LLAKHKSEKCPVASSSLEEKIMHDRVDMEQTAQAIRQKRRYARRRQLGMLAMVGMALLSMAGMTVFMLRAFSSVVDLLHFDGERWQEVQGVPRRPEEVQISPSGVVWVATRDGISRFDGTAWRHYRGRDYGADSGRLRGGFALRGEEVWGVTEDAVIHFDGQRWKAFPEALVSNRPRDVVVSESEVWVIDAQGNLSRLNGEEWTISDLRDAIPGVDWGDILSPPDPILVRTPDGALWLALEEGLWRFDGAAWREVRPGEERLDQADLVGVSGDRLWFQDDEHLLWVAFDESDWGRYTRADLGLPDKARIYQVAAWGERLGVASSAGVLILDGVDWEHLPSPAGKGRVTGLALAPDGTVWAIGYERNTIRFMLPTILGLVVMMGGMFLIVFVSRRSPKSATQSYEKAREAVRQLVSDLPGEEQPPAAKETPPWQWIALVLGLVLLALGVIAGGRFIERTWSDAPRWTVEALIVVIFPLVLMLVMWLVSKYRASRGEASSLPWGDLSGIVRMFVSYVVMFIVFRIVVEAVIEWLASLFGSPALTLAAPTLAYFALLLGPKFLTHWFLPYWVRVALRRANYARALRRMRLLRRLSASSVRFLHLHGTVHFFAGEYQQAEGCLRESLIEELKPTLRMSGSALEDLGHTLVRQGRYEEAIKVFEVAIEVAPDKSGAYNGLAEVYLRNDLRAERALELLQRALENLGDSFLRRRSKRYQRGQLWANRAWALTVQRLHAQAGEALEQALRKTDRGFKPGLADLHCRAGQVMRLRGDKVAAVEHWQQAQQIDPQGQAGQWATRLLQELT
jgi:tetratricopeptide (TPR) repeat protein